MSGEAFRGVPAAELTPDERSAFMARVYARLTAAVALFVAFEWFLFSSGMAETITALVLETSWLLVLGGFMLVSWLANSLAFRSGSSAVQGVGLLLLVAANALIFAPLLFLAELQVPGLVGSAGQYAVLAFLALSVVAHRSARDFVWLGATLRWVGILALAAIVISALTGFVLGTWFSLAMIGFAGAVILHDTQSILRTTPVGRETAAAMLLFSGVAMMFWYIVRLLMAVRR